MDAVNSVDSSLWLPQHSIRGFQQYLNNYFGGLDRVVCIPPILDFSLCKYLNKVAEDVKTIIYFGKNFDHISVKEGVEVPMPAIYTFKFDGRKMLMLLHLSSEDHIRGYIFLERESADLIPKLINKLREYQKAARELWLWGHKWIKVDKLDVSCFVPPQMVMKHFNAKILPQLQTKKVFNHVLFYSNPGFGKSAFMRWLAKNYQDWSVIAVRPASLDKPHAIFNVFNEGQTYQPTIIFFEDIDIIGQHRTQLSHEFNPFLGALLNSIDGLEQHEKILVIGATNNPQSLDPALLRPGRLGIHIPFSYTKNERVKILNTYLNQNFSAEELSFVGDVSPAHLRAAAKMAVATVELESDKLTPTLIKQMLQEVLGDKSYQFEFKPTIREPANVHIMEDKQAEEPTAW